MPIFLAGVGLMIVWAVEYAGNVRVAITLTRFRRGC